MAYIGNNTRRYRIFTKIATTIALSACLMVGAYAISSAAESHGGHQGGGGGSHGVGHRGVGHQSGGHWGGGHWGGGRGYGRGHYAAPPVIYGSPYCDTPPLLFVPFIGFNQPCY